MALSDLKYVTTGAWGAGLARPLTAAEADGNVQTLRAAVQDLIDNPVEGVSVSNITVSGRQLTFHMSDTTTKGPFTLPIAYPRWRGEWEAAGSYAVFDIVTATGNGTFLVAQDHTAAATFDPNASNVDGPLYIQIAEPASGGGVAAVVAISDSMLTLDASHGGKYLRVTSSGLDVTIPPGLYADGTEIIFRQTVAGYITIFEGSGVVINVPTGFYAGSDFLGATITMKHIGADEWDIYGDLGVMP